MKQNSSMRRVSLRQKLILSSILCLMLPAVITLIVSSANTKSVIQRQAIDNALGSLEVIDRYIENMVNKMLYVTNFVQFDSEIQSIVRQKSKADIDDSKAQFVVDYFNTKKITEKLNNVSFPGERTHISIVLNNGTTYTNYTNLLYDAAQIVHEPWFKHLNDIHSSYNYWIGTHPAYLEDDREEGRYYITIAQTIKSFSSKPDGYLIVSLSEEQISHIFPKNKSNHEFMLLDSNGTILSHMDASQIGQPFSHFDEIDEQSSSSIIKVGREKFLLLDRKLSISDWRLVSMVPYQEALSQINAVQSTNVIVQALFFILFLLILVTLVRQFTKPIFKLSRAVSKVESGNLQYRTRMQASDEIGQLGQSFDQMLDRIEEMIHQVTLEQAGKRKAELEMLQAQINPHFLFNVLNSIRLKIKLGGDDKNAALISSLSSLLRMTINRNNEFVTLHEEVETVVHYFKLMNFRTNDSNEIHIDILPETALIEVPRFVIQPIIENSLIHGLQDHSGLISITAHNENGCLHVQISDTGRGMNGEELSQLLDRLASDKQAAAKKEEVHKGLSGIGLKNVFERLKLIYGEDFQYVIESKLGLGTIITLKIPLRRGE
ncbi:sensor histidine kinase [Paenibacillus sp. IITD108]|uniref:sensor histidine kinase n=1 Tax=Paenibacillus sp. IITD108 TaxID=3116649 RepID=UPI002F3EE176